MHFSSNAQHDIPIQGIVTRLLRVNKPDCTTDHKEKSMIKKIFYMELEYQNYNKYKQESGH